MSWGTAMVSLLVALSVECKHNKNCTIADETKNCLDLNYTVIYLRLSSTHCVVHVRFFFAWELKDVSKQTSLPTAKASSLQALIHAR